MIATTTETKFDHVVQVPGGDYYYAVCAVNDGGSICSPVLHVDLPPPPPPAPTLFRIAPVERTIDKVQLSWRRISSRWRRISSRAAIELLRTTEGQVGDTIIHLNGRETSYIDTLVPQKTYVYLYLLRYRFIGGSWSPAAQASMRLPLPVPPAPTALSSTALDAGNISLTWSPPADFPSTSSQRIDRVVQGTWMRVDIAEPWRARSWIRR